jgi:DNA-directed RNA polymerase subunit L
MEIKVLEDKKNKLIIELIGETHAFCNALKKELWNDKGIKVAGYNIEHPLVGNPKIIVETDGKKAPKKALIDAAERLKKGFDSLRKEFLKSVK